ncbi:polyketide synthase [Aliikangiella coralliicola]|uniref:Enoyl-CoA hydratase n=1 Tax=Aliikangiella coralliicola TaxID=2592383 RepID=A0A545U946_9GAMM|nr:polyketide synthase [Aliikangiella coralliicola]TQV85996.1 enoyl-CoA hydratase [Aliikangiella coralliicola]
MSDQVIELTEVDEGIIQIKMQDKVNKNTFSDALTQGLIEAFETIKNQLQYKVVILTGFDSYFASGGTQEALLYLSDGKGKFSDTDLYSLALNCPIPVISAMQGHGIGGGFVMGLFADFVILSRESVYTTNFMKYGFTPGMGATFILPQKLGIGLAEEMLLAAKTYRGGELQQRGIPFPVLPRSEVMDYALDLAKTLAEKPRVSLVTLKDHLVAPLREKLPEIIEQEVIMHDKTFHQPEVKDRIEAFFGQ